MMSVCAMQREMLKMVSAWLYEGMIKWDGCFACAIL